MFGSLFSQEVKLAFVVIMNFLFSFAKGAKVYLRGIDEKFFAKSKSINVDCTQYKLEENVFYESLP